MAGDLRPDSSDVSTSLARLAEREPRAGAILEVLHDRGILHARPLDDDLTTADILLKILVKQRHALFDSRHIFWGVLERLVNPARVTQKVARPFVTGKEVAETCVSSAVVSMLIARLPADFVRMIDGLTSPNVGFEIRRAYPEPALYEARKRFLQSAFLFVEAGMQTLRIWVAPDATAAARAADEHAARRHRTYDFTGERANTRHLIDVLIQATLTNYVLQGHYVAEADIDTRTGAGGVPLPGDANTRFALDALLQDFLSGSRVICLS